MIPDQKPAELCTSLEDVRTIIDRLDDEIIALFAQRFKYTSSAHRFKSSESDVRAPHRAQAVLDRVKAKAAAQGIDPGVINDMYSLFVQYCIEEQLKIWKTVNNQ